MGKIAFIRLLNTCNCKCEMCSVWRRPPEEFDFDELKKIILTVKKHGFDKIIFTGGEPTIYTKFKELISFLNKNNFSFALITNGSIIQEKWNQLFSEKKPDFIIFSLDSFSKKYHDTNRGFPGIHDKVTNAIRFVISKKVNIIINTVITKNNYKELLEFIKFDFFKNLMEWQWMPVKFSPELALRKKEWKEIKKTFDLYNKINSKPRIVSVFDFPENLDNLSKENFTGNYYSKNDCKICEKMLFIDINGNVYRCNSFDDRLIDKVRFGNFREKGLDNLIKKMEKEIILPKPGCVNCDARNQRYNSKGVLIDCWSN
ncbi:MAG: radical SAM protein [Candidatus ainarchaeum sp.]|nr:radical SAM protein [Candidatus ainarchaeum sp.]